MKLSDFDKVAALGKEREYLKSLVAFAGALYVMRLQGVDVRPDLKAKLVGPMTDVFKAEIARVDSDLAALGVETGDAALIARVATKPGARLFREMPRPTDGQGSFSDERILR